MIAARIISTDGEHSTLSEIRVYNKEMFAKQQELVRLYDDGASHYLVDIEQIEETTMTNLNIGDVVVITSRDLCKVDEGHKEFAVTTGYVTDMATTKAGPHVEVDHTWHPLVTETVIQMLYTIKLPTLKDPIKELQILRKRHPNDAEFGRKVSSFFL